MAAVSAAAIGLTLAACGGDDETADTGVVIDPGDPTPLDGPGIILHGESIGDDPLVAMVGDSLTVGSSGHLEALAAELEIDLVINAEVGRRMTVSGTVDSGVSAVEDILAEFGEPDLWVVALGTNDIAQYDTVDAYTQQIDALLAVIPEDAPIVWIDVYVVAYPEQSATINDALRQRLSDRPETRMSSWSDIADGDGVLSDGIHPSDEGRVEFVALVDEAISSWLD